MAGLRDLLNGEKDHGEEARKAVKAIAKDFPHVAEILGGLPAKDGKDAVSPSAITIWVQDGKARFSTNVKSASKTILGDVADIANPWASINCIIGTGEVSSKRYTERENRLTDDQKQLLL